MNSPFPGNSEATYEPLMNDFRCITLSSIEVQRSFITPSNSLWQQKPPHMEHENPLPVSLRKDLNRNESSQSAALSSENQAAIELLRRWREEDEQVSDDQDNAQKLATDSSAIPVENEPSQGVVLSPESQELIQLPRSWREEDEYDEEKQISDDDNDPQKLAIDSSAISIENEPSQGVVLSPESQELIQLLRSWRESDDQERIDTWEYLKQALDEDRFSERKLFP